MNFRDKIAIDTAYEKYAKGMKGVVCPKCGRKDNLHLSYDQEAFPQSYGCSYCGYGWKMTKKEKEYWEKL